MLVSESIAARVPMLVAPLLNKLLAPIAMAKEEKQSECLKCCDCSQAQLTAKKKAAESTRWSFGAIRCRVVDVRTPWFGHTKLRFLVARTGGRAGGCINMILYCTTLR